MAEHIKDEDDRRIEAMFAALPLEDNGFSNRIVRKIRRRLWVRRLALPVAAIIGGAIAIKPLGSLVTLLFAFLKSLPVDFVTASASWLPSLPMIGLGGMLLVATMLGIRMLGE
ncbi:MAG: hypothetical protein HKN77_03255 [Woeseiaceae bacterium]|nr:hypothetical protein [Woeseiaceae bacterium]